MPSATCETFDQDSGPNGLEDDLRWQVAKRVVAGPHFCKSPLLSRFLLYIVAKSVEERPSEITGRQIGVRVFGRPPGYRMADDNIVRNYARQLRKRLAEHFAGEGTDEPIRIEIPLGGYIPYFPSAPVLTHLKESRKASMPMFVKRSAANRLALLSWLEIAARSYRSGVLVAACLLAAYSVALICLTRIMMPRIVAAHRSTHQASEPASLLWASILDDSHNTYIVPPDAGLSILEDLSQHPLPLADYLKGGYMDPSLPRMDAHRVRALGSQQLTGFVDLQIVTALARRPEYDPEHIFLRFPRDLRLDDLKVANAVIIGPVCSNPWAVLAEASVNFHIVCNPDVQSATILNMKPQTGELTSYTSRWDEPVHETFAVIAFVPNPTRSGHLLLLEGLDVAGTQAAAEVILHTDAILPILERAKRPGGLLGSFEVLLQSSSIQSNATDTRVIASRIH